MGVVRSGSVLVQVTLVRESLNQRCWMVWPSLGVGVGAGRDRAGFLSNKCVWVVDGSGAVENALWVFFPMDGCGRPADGYVLGLGMFTGAVLDRSRWVVGKFLAGW